MEPTEQNEQMNEPEPLINRVTAEPLGIKQRVRGTGFENDPLVDMVVTLQSLSAAHDAAAATAATAASLAQDLLEAKQELEVLKARLT